MRAFRAAARCLPQRLVATTARSTTGFPSARAAGLALAGSCAAGVALNCSPSLPHTSCDEGGMKYRMLGNTGLQVSVLGYGFWATFGAKDDLMSQEGVDVAKECMRVVRKAGVNLFDHAELYGTPFGAAEEIFGKALEQLQKEDPVLWRRSDLVITTKIFWGGKGVNEKGLSRKHVLEGLDACLRRLRVDYVDCLFCHRPDPFTPTETVVRAMTDAVRSGKATSWGTSEWSAVQIMEAIWIARTYGLEPPQFEQPEYNMFNRERFEKEYHPLYAAPYNYGTTIWSPLASGLLTGKYNKGTPEGSRAANGDFKNLVGGMVDRWRKEGRFDKVEELQTYAKKELNCTMSQLAIAWCLANKNVSTVLLGATKPQQLEETLPAIEVAKRLTPAHMAKIEEILKTAPVKYAGYGGAGMRQLDTL